MLAEDWNSGGGNMIPGGAVPNGRDILNGLHGVADATALKAIPARQRSHGMLVRVIGGILAGEWYWHDTCALTANDVLVVAPTDIGLGAGRWLRKPGAVDLALPFSSATLDAAALLTMQAGQRLWVQSLYWEILVSMTGGTTPAIGASSNKTAPTNWSTKGDLLGGGSGDLTATLTAGVKAGTIGTDMDTLTKVRGLILVPTDTIRFDRIADAFAAGNGYIRTVGILLANAGA